MDRDTAQVLDRIAFWPKEDQEELAEIAAAIEARRAGVHVLTEEERLAVEEGLAQLDQGESFSEEEMQAVWRRYRTP